MRVVLAWLRWAAEGSAACTLSAGSVIGGAWGCGEACRGVEFCGGRWT